MKIMPCTVVDHEFEDIERISPVYGTVELRSVNPLYRPSPITFAEIEVGLGDSPLRPSPISSRSPLFGTWIGTKAERLWVWVERDPDHVMRRSLFLCAALTILGSFSMAAGLGITVLFASAVLAVWGSASILTYAVTGDVYFDPRLGAVLLFLGVGTGLVALGSTLS